MNPAIPRPVGTNPAGLLLSRDMFFTSKITGTARLLGRQVLIAGNVELAKAMIDDWHPAAVFIDLAAGHLIGPDALVAYREAAGPDVPFIAFGTHVDTAGLAAARAAGCDPVLPRSAFTSQLPDLVRKFLGSDEPEPTPEAEPAPEPPTDEVVD
jgi:CheY-like chemotaxis protein